MIGARDRHFAGLDRLAQAIEEAICARMRSAQARACLSDTSGQVPPPSSLTRPSGRL
jgi:hypothetical protein